MSHRSDGLCFSETAFSKYTTLGESLMKVCRARGLVVDVRFLAPEPVGERDRRVLAERLRGRIAAELHAFDGAA